MARILVVDDDPDFVEIVRLVLQSEGYEVVSAANGDMALEMMRETPPDLILLDVMMAGVLDGVHVAHAMSESALLRHVPLIMVSSIIDSPMADMFPTDEYIPIDAWISKPVQPDDLLAKVEKLIGS